MDACGRVVYHHPLAAPARAVVCYLDHVGVEYEARMVDVAGGETKGEAFLAKNPLGLVPVLEEDGGTFCLSESSAILAYFQPDADTEDTASVSASHSPVASPEQEPDDLPDSPRAVPPRTAPCSSARIDEYMGYHHESVARLSSEAFVPLVTAPDAAQRAAAWDAVARAVAPVLERWNTQLGQQPYVAGHSVSIGDFLFACEVDQLHVYGLLTGYLSIRRYLLRMQEIAAYQQCFQRLVDDLAAMDALDPAEVPPLDPSA